MVSGRRWFSHRFLPAFDSGAEPYLLRWWSQFEKKIPPFFEPTPPAGGEFDDERARERSEEFLEREGF